MKVVNPDGVSAFTCTLTNSVTNATKTFRIFDATDIVSTVTGTGHVTTATFTVGFSSAYDGKMFIGLTTTQTSELTEGRHVYDVNVKTGDTVYRIVEGQIMVRGGISSTL